MPFWMQILHSGVFPVWGQARRQKDSFALRACRMRNAAIVWATANLKKVLEIHVFSCRHYTTWNQTHQLSDFHSTFHVGLCTSWGWLTKIDLARYCHFQFILPRFSDGLHISPLPQKIVSLSIARTAVMVEVQVEWWMNTWSVLPLEIIHIPTLLTVINGKMNCTWKLHYRVNTNGSWKCIVDRDETRWVFDSTTWIYISDEAQSRKCKCPDEWKQLWVRVSTQGAESDLLWLT